MVHNGCRYILGFFNIYNKNNTKMEHLKTPQELNEASENLNISDVSNSLYQDNSTRRPNGLLFKMRELFNNETLTTWEYGEFMKMVQSFAKENNFHFDKDKEQLYRREE